VKFRDEIGSLPVLVRALDAALFPPNSTEVKSKSLTEVAATPLLETTTPPIQSATLSAEPANQTNSSADKMGVASEGTESADEDEVKSKCVGASRTFPMREYVLPELLSERQCDREGGGGLGGEEGGQSIHWQKASVYMHCNKQGHTKSLFVLEARTYRTSLERKQFFPIDDFACRTFLHHRSSTKE